MATVGYEPSINLQDMVKEKKADKTERRLISKIAVAGFCFGNVMLLSFPDYFGMGNFEQTYKDFFGWLNLAFAIPTLLYSGSDYFVSAWANLKAKRLNLDFPLALGIAVMFVRSAYEIILKTGPGFVDTLCGLVFFLLVGKWMQQRTFHHISFERDYRSYFPVAVTTIIEGNEKSIALGDLRTGDRILIRNMEIIPADAILLNGTAEIDFSFVTGESIPVVKTLGEVVYAGGRQLGGALEMEVIKPVSQSYLTQLWNNEAFHKPKNNIKTFSDTASKYFSIALLIVAFGAAGFWAAFDNQSKALAAFTAVLIIACPCALALSSPFTLAAAISVFDKNKFYLKNTAVVEELARIDTFIFDKTGTITSPDADGLEFKGAITEQEKQIVSDLARNSGHPLSRELTKHLEKPALFKVENYTEKIGRGISGTVAGNTVKLGSSAFLDLPLMNVPQSSVHIMINDVYLGYYIIKQQWRKGFKEMVLKMGGWADLHLLSGDRDQDRERLIPFFSNAQQLHFGQSPQDKLNYVSDLQAKGAKVLMFGDGLNDSGALKQSDLGIAVTDNINNFSPGCDAVLDGQSFKLIPQFIKQAKDAVKVIHLSFAISLIYNAVGLSLAVQGLLSPLMAAILMPLSTITIILFTTLMVRLFAHKNKLL
jgi:P-type Cu+ transporter